MKNFQKSLDGCSIIIIKLLIIVFSSFTSLPFSSLRSPLFIFIDYCVCIAKYRKKSCCCCGERTTWSRYSCSLSVIDIFDSSFFLLLVAVVIQSAVQSFCLLVVTHNFFLHHIFIIVVDKTSFHPYPPYKKK